MRLKQRVAIITGASRGIGKATALLFAREGASVVVNFIKSEKEAQDVVREITDMGGSAIACRADVSDEKQVKGMIETTIKQFKRIDVLVNNAGIVFDVPFEDRTVEQWRRTVDVNLIGTFLCSKHASAYMIKAGYGRIVNVASTNGIDTLSPSSLDYDASKAGVISLTKNLATELAPAVLVNAVAPGWVDTDINKDLSKEFIASEVDNILLGRFGRPEEIAQSILFLACDDSSYTTGATLVVSGGLG